MTARETTSRRLAPAWTRRQIITRAGMAAAALAARPSLAGAAKATSPRPETEPVWVNGRRYDAYIPAASKPAQFAPYSCEFDAAWVIFRTFGLEVGFEEQLAIIGHNQDPEPFWQETPTGIVITGGNIGRHFCGDYTGNIVAKTRSSAMRQVFDAYNFPSRRVTKREDVELSLLAGGLVFVKCTVDFAEYVPATWVTTNGRHYPVPLTNDHAVVAIGFNVEGVVIRDLLGPTNTNWNRQAEYEVPWDIFVASAESHEWDGRAVFPPPPAL